ncbi:MAG: amidohydrolase family protein [Sphingomonadaceae bacterium]
MTSKSGKILLRGGTVLTLEPGDDPFVGDVLVESGKIAAIGPDIAADPASCEIVDAVGRIVFPGFVDTHRHLWQSPFRLAGADWLVPDYCGAMYRNAGPLYTPQDLGSALRIGLFDALNAGVTQVFDWNHNVNSPEHADATVAAHASTGARVIFGYGQSTPVWAVLLDPTIGTSNAMPSDDLERVRREHYASNSGLLRLAMAARGPEVSPMGIVIAEAEQAKRLGLRSSLHVGNGPLGTNGTIRKMRDAGILDSTFTFIHCNTLPTEELEMMTAAGCSASVSTELEQHMGHGHPAATRLLAAGIRPSLSVDTCTNVSGDLFAVMRATLSAVRGDANAEVLKSGGMPDKVALSAREILEFATIEGARANGTAACCGTLAVGKDADIAVISTDAPNLLPLTNPYGAVVMGAHPGNIETVLVAGAFVKRNFELVAISIADLRREAEALQTSLGERIAQLPVSNDRPQVANF